MPYALSNLQDGKVPSARYVTTDYTASPGEVIVTDSNYREDWVWDAANQSLRALTDTELLAEAKRARKSALEARGVGEMQNVMPVYRALVLLARNTQPRDPRLAGLTQVDDKLTSKLARIEAANSISDVESVEWEG